MAAEKGVSLKPEDRDDFARILEELEKDNLVERPVDPVKTMLDPADFLADPGENQQPQV